MNILKLGRGDFFGVIIPGAFLLINIIIFFPFSSYGIDIEWLQSGKKEGAMITIMFVVSYILGFALRLIKPDIIEKVSFLFLLPDIVFKSMGEAKKKKKKEEEEEEKEKKIYEIFSETVKFYREAFPYIDWFYKKRLSNAPASVHMFFDRLLIDEFSGDTEIMKGLVFINQCKLFVRNKSNSLSDEIMFCEGNARFVSGITYALILNVAMLIFFHPDNIFMLVLYLILAIIFIRRLKYMRIKEVATILCALAITHGVE